MGLPAGEPSDPEPPSRSRDPGVVAGVGADGAGAAGGRAMVSGSGSVGGAVGGGGSLTRARQHLLKEVIEVLYQ